MKTVKWGVVGFGEQARKRMIPALKKIKEIEIKSICCSSPERAEEVEKEFGIPAYGKLSDFLEDKEISVVYIATPHHLHTPQAFKSLEAGKNVLVEKPIALSVDGVHKLTEVAHRKNLKLGVCFPLRHHPCLKEVKDEIIKEELGDIISAYVYLSRAKLQDNPWWKDQFHSGPMCMMDLGLQGIDLILWLISKKAIEVSAIGKGGKTDDCLNTAVVISINFEDNTLTVISSNNMARGESNLLMIQGTKRQIFVEMNWPDGDGSFKLIRRGAGKEDEKKYEPVDLFRLLAENFNNAVQGKATYSPSSEESFPVVEVCCAGIESLKSGKTVKVGEIPRVSTAKYKENKTGGNYD